MVKLASLSGKASVEKGYWKSYFNATAALLLGNEYECSIIFLITDMGKCFHKGIPVMFNFVEYQLSLYEKPDQYIRKISYMNSLLLLAFFV